MWEKEFVPYELAVKLKKLGFDEPCIYYFNKSENNQLWQDIDSWSYRNSVVSKGNLLWGETYDNGNVSTPLWQQVEDWFLKEHKLYGIVIPTATMHWTYKIIAMDGDVVEEPPYKDVNGADYSTKEGAREAMFKEMSTMIK